MTKFWVSTGGYTAGTVIDITQIGQSIDIDFTGRIERTAIVTQDASNNYTVTYVLNMSQSTLYLAYNDESRYSVARYVSSENITSLSLGVTIRKTYTLTWDHAIAAANFVTFKADLGVKYPSVTILNESNVGNAYTVQLKGRPPVDTEETLYQAVDACSNNAVIT